MKKYFLSTFILFSFLVLPICVFAVTNSGFIPGQIWYSKETLVEGDTVNVHTAVWNGEKSSLSVKVEFYDKNVILGVRDIVLLSSELKDVYVPWKITAGDHIISAKIISSSATVSGKKESISLDRNTTLNDKQFVSVITKNDQGVPVSTSPLSDALKNQLNNTTMEINSIVPEKVATTISDSITSLDNFRDETSLQMATMKDATQNELDKIKIEEQKNTQTPSKKVDIQTATEKPITYIKLFLLTILTFIFTNKIVFYGICIFVVFLILRFIYRRIRNR
jgi:hypothetical protein